MPKYRVHFNTVASATVNVEAEDREAAIEEAFQEVPSICAQCSGWGRDYSMDLGDWETADQGFTVEPQSIEETAEEVAP